MYSAFAEYYDLFMADSGHERRLEIVLNALGERTHGADLACGTGALTIELKKKGYDVYGVDISPEMLLCAGEKAKKSGVSINFIRQDINKFEPIKKLDFVTCVCDGVNYLKSPEKLFARISAALKKGGLFIFDISTEYKLKRVLGGNVFSETVGGVTYIWKNILFKNRVEMFLTFFEQKSFEQKSFEQKSFEQKGELFVRTEESQTQYIHDIEHLLSLLKSDFSVKILGENGKKPVETTERVFFIATKK